MISLPTPNTEEEIYDSFAFFEQIISDYYIEKGELFSEVLNIRKDILNICNSNFYDLLKRFDYYKSLVDLISKSPITTEKFYCRPKIPECRSYKPIAYNEMVCACNAFSKRYSLEKSIVLGIRTAGCWGGAILANNLKAKGADVQYLSLRPIKAIRYDMIAKCPFYSSDEEFSVLNEYLNRVNFSCVVIVDDPVYTGKTLKAFVNFLLNIGVNRIIYFPLGNITEINFSHIETFCYSFSTDERMKENFVISLYQKGYHSIEVCDGITMHSTFFLFQDEMGQRYKSKFVGMGWYGKIEWHRGKICNKFVCNMVTYFDGHIIQKLCDLDKAEYKSHDLIEQYNDYLKLIEDNFKFRSINGIACLWYNTSFINGKWYICSNQLINNSFEAGHWGKLISKDTVVKKDINLLKLL